MIFSDEIPSDCTCTWLRAGGAQPGFVLHRLASSCEHHRHLRWVQPSLYADTETRFWPERGAEE